MDKLVKHIEKNILLYSVILVAIILLFPKIKNLIKKQEEPPPPPPPAPFPNSQNNNTTGGNTSIVGTSIYTADDVLLPGSKIYVKDSVRVIDRDFLKINSIRTSYNVEELDSVTLSNMVIDGLPQGSLKVSSSSGLLGEVELVRDIKIDGIFNDDYIRLVKLKYTQNRWVLWAVTTDSEPKNFKFPANDGSKTFYKTF